MAEDYEGVQRENAGNTRFFVDVADVGGGLRRLSWRREWDSNPRYGFPYTRFPSVRLKPLGHPSGMETSMENRKGNIAAGFPVTTRRVMRGTRQLSRVAVVCQPTLQPSDADRGTPPDLSW